MQSGIACRDNDFYVVNYPDEARTTYRLDDEELAMLVSPESLGRCYNVGKRVKGISCRNREDFSKDGPSLISKTVKDSKITDELALESGL